MEYLKVIGKDKADVKIVEEFLDKIKFEENVKAIFFESKSMDIPYEKTITYKKFITKLKQSTKYN